MMGCFHNDDVAQLKNEIYIQKNIVKSTKNSKMVEASSQNGSRCSEPLAAWPLIKTMQPDRTKYAGRNMSCYKLYCGHWELPIECKWY